MLPYRKENKLLARELRNHATEAERLLWEQLRWKQILNVPFYRQKSLANFIVDFYCAAASYFIISQPLYLINPPNHPNPPFSVVILFIGYICELYLFFWLIALHYSDV
ncbi:endonuclease domain-containing protein [Chromatium okenii]|jgi:hypothetical protein|uniref:DUF559 domain-containing protein n=1 Tax=Chromatium okenii TaxID=61644 RepID=A0A2S7XR08_9GAMM|nr:hypothetical protein CXB77_10170 [Chromatium okenii]